MQFSLIKILAVIAQVKKQTHLFSLLGSNEIGHLPVYVIIISKPKVSLNCASLLIRCHKNDDIISLVIAQDDISRFLYRSYLKLKKRKIYLRVFICIRIIATMTKFHRCYPDYSNWCNKLGHPIFGDYWYLHSQITFYFWHKEGVIAKKLMSTTLYIRRNTVQTTGQTNHYNTK